MLILRSQGRRLEPSISAVCMEDLQEQSMHGDEKCEHQGEDEEVMEKDPEGRYLRYRELVGRGKFKACHKAFDSQIGIDVAWSKFNAASIQLADEELEAVVHDIQTNLDLEHPNIIKSFQCWEDRGNHCINLITELFTSGNLRQYRNQYKHLDLKAVKRMARQILRGLQYLHSQEPPITHGDLRCDKIYVNGNCGEIKIGDIGLATLMPYRWKESEGDAPPCLPGDFKSGSCDIFAFGLCMLELLTLKQLDLQHCANWRDAVAEVQDEEARTFIFKCLTGKCEHVHIKSQVTDLRPWLILREGETWTPPLAHTARLLFWHRLFKLACDIFRFWF